MATKLVKQIDEDVKLYMDNKTGIAWIAGHKTSEIYAPHPCILSRTDLYNSWDGCGTERIKIGINDLTYDVAVTFKSNHPYDQIAKEHCLCIGCRKQDSIMKLLKINELQPGKMYDMINNPMANYLLYFVDDQGNLWRRDTVVKVEGMERLEYNEAIKADFYEV
ncbi:hypothetical protein ACK8P5_26160 (plasmid) [Paenibacillus sp. EC2-1]|uniref:hypothetical protein n=1 Tax=Paenibacillus sp. EC2-1 TaxID=3388665 RepID=UPI003BEED6BF